MRVMRGFILLLATAVAPTIASAQTYPSSNDPRSTLKPGRFDAGVAASNMKLLSFSPKPAQFDTVRGLTFVNSDMAFGTHFAYQANFAGFTIWDITDPTKPAVAAVMQCITSQGDPSIVGNLLFVSAEGAGNRNDCGAGGVQDPKDHMAGVRIFDVTNSRAPKLIKNVQTCKGSHTHTVVPSPTDANIIYLYVSGQQAARPETELAGCKNGTDPADPTNSLYQLDIIKVQLNHPERAVVIPGARIFTGLDGSGECKQFCAPADARRAAAGRGRGGAPGAAPGGAAATASAAGMPASTGPRNCHDVTAYPALHLLAAACSTHSILVDISNPEKPVRIDALTDTNNFQGRHTAAFSNDGKKLVQTDEWGGGTGPMCQASSMIELGGNTIISLDAKKKQAQHAYFKLPSAQSAEENCVSHNGGIIPVPGRDLYVQGWYQGGVDVMDFTDQDHAFEIAYFDRGSIDPPALVDVPAASAAAAAGGGRGRGNTIGGSWGAYYWNGLIYSSELDRGMDIYELTPSAQLSANEIAAAKLVTFTEYNPQSQPKMTWPPAFVVVRSYLDQLVRGTGLASDRTSAISAALDAAEMKSGVAQAAALNALAVQVDGDVKVAKDGARVRTMASEIRRLAAARK